MIRQSITAREISGKGKPMVLVYRIRTWNLWLWPQQLTVEPPSVLSYLSIKNIHVHQTSVKGLPKKMPALICKHQFGHGLDISVILKPKQDKTRVIV
jgi:hypothetical protein